MYTMRRVSEVMITISGVIASIALIMMLSGAWLAYVPYVNRVVYYSSPIFWRSLVAMFWWWVLRAVFRRLEMRQNRKIAEELLNK